MNLLINDKEIVAYLVSLIDIKTHLDNLPFGEWNMFEAVHWYVEKRNETEKFDKNKWKDKLKQKLRKGIEQDLSVYWGKIKEEKQRLNKKNTEIISKNLEKIITVLGFDAIEKSYRKSKKENFIKSVGSHLNKKAKLVRRKHFEDYKSDCLIRNTTGNENLLLEKIQNKYAFWFIDSGYTNFLESNKRWHRLVRSHLHTGTYFDAPADRLGNFKKFPMPWRESGSKILVIEPGPFSANIFKISIPDWKKEIEKQIRDRCDLPIVFREKTPKKTRSNLSRHLQDEDYYCVININSNAATEAIWAGIPVITLDRHITNPVSRNSIEYINDLYRPNLGPWLCMLSYSQFTFEELANGKAVELVKKHHV